MKCPVCHDEGIEGGCVRCGKEPRVVVKERIGGQLYDSSVIPEHYQGKMWSAPNSEDKELYIDFDTKLTKIHDNFMVGRFLNFSLFIATPPKYGKLDFAYSCMQTALSYGYSVAPLLSTSEWRRLYTVSKMNSKFKMYGKFTWDELILCDVLFLTVDHGDDDRYDDIVLLKDIYDIRARRNLPTVVISDFRLESLVPRWKSDSYTLLHNTARDCDRLRYPIILHRFLD